VHKTKLQSRATEICGHSCPTSQVKQLPLCCKQSCQAPHPSESNDAGQRDKGKKKRKCQMPKTGATQQRGSDPAHLLAHGHDEAHVAFAAARDAVQPPPRAQGDGGDVERAVDGQVYLLHLQRDERGRVEAAVHVGLVAGHVWGVDGRRVGRHRVRRRRRGQQQHGVGRRVHRGAVHPRRRPRRGHAAGEHQPLRQLQPVLHRAREVLHLGGRTREWRSRRVPTEARRRSGDRLADPGGKGVRQTAAQRRGACFYLGARAGVRRGEGRKGAW
jgi:hypothetical protein